MEPAVREPSLKGSILVLMVKGVKLLLREGRARLEDIESELDASDMQLLGDKILPGVWYPMATFDRFARIVKRHFGAGRPQFLVEQGRIAAEQLTGGEIYRHYADRALTDRERGGKMMVALSKVLFNFTEWSIGPGAGEDEHIIEVRDAEAFPDTLRYAGEGFIEYAASRLRQETMRVRSERPAPDRILFRIEPA